MIILSIYYGKPAMILPTFMVRGMGNGVQKYKEEPIVGSLILLDEVKFN